MRRLVAALVCAAAVATLAPATAAAAPGWTSAPVSEAGALNPTGLEFAADGSGVLTWEGFVQGHQPSAKLTGLALRSPAGIWTRGPDVPGVTWGLARVHVVASRTVMVGMRAYAFGAYNRARWEVVTATGQLDGSFGRVRALARPVGWVGSASGGHGEVLAAWLHTGHVRAADRAGAAHVCLRTDGLAERRGTGAARDRPGRARAGGVDPGPADRGAAAYAGRPLGRGAQHRAEGPRARGAARRRGGGRPRDRRLGARPRSARESRGNGGSGPRRPAPANAGRRTASSRSPMRNSRRRRRRCRSSTRPAPAAWPGPGARAAAWRSRWLTPTARTSRRCPVSASGRRRRHRALAQPASSRSRSPRRRPAKALGRVRS